MPPRAVASLDPSALLLPFTALWWPLSLLFSF
jgi:hypothetical protein